MSQKTLRRRRLVVCAIIAVVGAVFIAMNQDSWEQKPFQVVPQISETTGVAAEALKKLPVKGRAAKTGYERSRFGEGWEIKDGCSIRDIILHRDMKDTVVDEGCKVTKGILDDPYTGKTIHFERGASTSAAVQIDHVVALSDAWQKGAQQLTYEKRKELANDPLELVAVDGPTNMKKGDGDAATWLPPNKNFRCQYVARQIAVKAKYLLWVTPAEKSAMARVLSACPGQELPS